MAEHVDRDAAPVLLSVVPRRALGGLLVALEHPVAEFAANREDPAEEAGIDELPDLAQPGQPELVLHDSVLQARRPAFAVERDGRGRVDGRGLLAVDRLAGGDGLPYALLVDWHGVGVEIYPVEGISQGGTKV